MYGHVGTEAGEEGEQRHVPFAPAAYEADGILQNFRQISVHFVRKTRRFFAQLFAFPVSFLLVFLLIVIFVSIYVH